MSAATSSPIRVIIAKVGLDGHDRGAKSLALALRDAGMEVIYTGLHQSPESVVAMALQEDADVLGVSLLSGAHLEIMERVCQLLRDHEARDVAVLLGGNIPHKDRDRLSALGVDAVFSTHTKFDDVSSWIRSRIDQQGE